MFEVIMLLRNWLSRNAVPLDDIKLIIEFPSLEAARTAERSFRLDPDMRTQYMVGDSEHKIAGIEFEFTYRKRKSSWPFSV